MQQLTRHCRQDTWLAVLKGCAHTALNTDHRHTLPTTPPNPWPYLQNKGTRKRLVRALTAEMPAGALALLPFYARIAATLAQVFPDVSVGEPRDGSSLAG